MSPDAELGETGSCHTELAVWKVGGNGGGMLQEELPCKTTLTVKAANTSQSRSTWIPGACTYQNTADKYRNAYIERRTNLFGKLHF